MRARGPWPSVGVSSSGRVTCCPSTHNAAEACGRVPSWRRGQYPGTTSDSPRTKNQLNTRFFVRVLTEGRRCGRVGRERMSGSLRSLRELNRLRVLEIVGERGRVSRADIARQTGLARSTVSSLVGDPQRDGLVIERETAAPSAGGRPPVL